MQIPIIQGSKKDAETSHSIVQYPVNCYAKDSKMRAIAGLVHYSDLPAIDRNGFYINSGFLQGHFRIAGPSLADISEKGKVTVITGPDNVPFVIAGKDRAVFAASVRNLGMVAGGKYYLYNPNEQLREISNTTGAALLGDVLDITWLRQSFILLVYRKAENAVYMQQVEVGQDEIIKSIRSEIDDSDPDRSVSIEAESDYFILFNKKTITFWQYQELNADKFSYRPATSKQIEGGLVGRDAKARLAGTWAFLSINVPGKEPNIYLLGSAPEAIGSIEIQNIIRKYSEKELSATVLESYQQDAIDMLIVHLPADTFMYNAQTGLWVTLQSKDDNHRKIPYRAINAVRDERNNEYIMGDKYRPVLGLLDPKAGSEYGRSISQIMYTPYTAFNTTIRHLLIEGIYGNWPDDEQPLLTIEASQGGITYGQPLTVRMPKGHDYIRKISQKGLGLFRGNISFRLEINTIYTVELDDKLYINDDADALVIPR